MRIAVAFFGALLVVAGLAGQIEASQHHPVAGSDATFGVASGWSPNTYSLVRIGGWALLIFGALIVAVALIREFRTAS
jgi:hypothetical protein